MDWETPFDASLEILEAYDTTVIQVQKKGTPTAEDGNGNPTKMTHQFIKLDRDIADAGGDEWVMDIMKKDVNGRLYIQLWKLVDGWLRYIRKEGEYIGIARAIEIVEKLDEWQNPQEEGYADLMTAFDAFTSIFDKACRDIIALRRKIREEGERNVFYKDTLYRMCAKNSQQLLCLRAIVRAYKVALTTDGDKHRQDLVDAIIDGIRDIDEPTRPREIEVVCVSIGTVCPAMVPRKELEKQFVDCGFKQYEGKKLSFKNKDMHTAAMSICISYGWRAVLDEQCFLCEEDGLAWAHERYKENSMLFGFKLDRNANACGNSGWDFMSGNIGFKSRRKHA